MNIYYSTSSSGIESADGHHEEPLETDVPRDDVEHLEHGGAHVAPKPAPTEPLTVDQSGVIKAQMFAEKSRADLLAEKLKTAEAEERKLRKMLRAARDDAGKYRAQRRAAREELEQEKAKVAHLRGIAGRVEEDEAA